MIPGRTPPPLPSRDSLDHDWLHVDSSERKILPSQVGDMFGYFSPTKSEIALEDEKKATIKKFAKIWRDPASLTTICTNEATMQPPGAPPIGVEEFVKTLGAFKTAFPDWTMTAEVLSIDDDGIAEVATQQFAGAMKKDLDAFGPWPEVKLEDAPEDIQKGLKLVFPMEIAAVEFTDDGRKIKKATWHSLGDDNGATTTHVDPSNGFIALYTVLGARKKIPMFFPPIMATHYVKKLFSRVIGKPVM